jgi:pyruvate dehydrogenase E2 component (dihydrolipoamide acetyltransferase)
MSAAWEVPVFHLTVSTRVDGLLAYRSASDESLTMTDLIVRRCSDALSEHRELNAHFIDETVVSFDVQNIGIAVATERGVIVPVIRDVGGRADRELVAERVRLVELARDGRIAPADMATGTFTISNLGMYGIEEFDAILNVPQVAILAVGAVTSRVILEDGIAKEEKSMKLTLTCDHRATDGALSAEFLQSLRTKIEQPS